MATNRIQEALGSRQLRGSERIRGGARTEYRPATIETPKQNTALADALGRWGETGQRWAGMKEEQDKKRAEERSNEIIRKLTPQQRRDAIQNGSLLYQDDPYAMEALRVKTGRNAAFLIDDEVTQKVKRGEFRTREEMEQYRHQRLQDGAKSYADEFGINPEDVDFQRGFNDNITDRNIAIYGSHDNYLSEQAKKGAVMNARVELNSVLNDPNVMRSPQSGEFLEGYFKNGLVTGAIPSDDEAHNMVMQTFSDAIQKEGGVDFLASAENREITLNGVTTTFKDLVGQEQWDNFKIRAQQNSYTLDAKRTEALTLSLNQAQLQDDPSVGMQMIQKLKAENDKIQIGEEMTPQRQMIINAEAALQDRVVKDNVERQKAYDKQVKSDRKQLVIDKVFDKRLSGEYVSTAYKDMPVDAETGEFTHSDMVNYADRKLNEIDQMELPDEKKDQLKLSYLRGDDTDGAFRTKFGVMVGDAQKEWTSAVVNGEMPESTPAIESLRRVYNADPSLMASLYPEQAEMFLTLDMMDNMGIKPQILIDADREAKGQTKEMRFEKDRAWADLRNNSEAPELSRIPTALDGAARKIYESFMYRTGNSDAAQQQVTKFLQENTVPFQAEGMDGKNVGIVTRNALMINSDPDSYKIGQDIISKAMEGIQKANPWITNGQLSVEERNGSIILQDSTGQVRIRYDKELMNRAYQDQAQKADEKARNDALKDANKRTLHTKAMNRKRERDEKREAGIKARGGMYGGLK